jgi:hypothetical protein
VGRAAVGIPTSDRMVLDVIIENVKYTYDLKCYAVISNNW